MKLKTFQAYTMAEALAAVRDDLGADAVILSTRTFKRGGMLGLGRRTIFEVTASAAKSAGTAAASVGPRPRNAVARQAYANGAKTARPTTTARAATAGDRQQQAATLARDAERQRTKRLAMVLAEKHKRETAAIPAIRPPALATAGPSGPSGPSAPPRSMTEVKALNGAVPALAAAGPVAAVAAAPAAAPTLKPTIPLSSANPILPPPPAPSTNGPAAGAARRFLLTPPDRQGVVTVVDAKRALGEPSVPAVAGSAAPKPSPDQPSAAVSKPSLATTMAAAVLPAILSQVKRPMLALSATSETQSRGAGSSAPAAAASTVTRAMQDELTAIKAMVGQVLHRQGRPAAGLSSAMPQPLFEMYLKLVAQDVAEDLADQIVNEVRDELTAVDLEDEKVVRAAVLRHLADYITVANNPMEHFQRNGRPLTIALIGPTGVGKTTTLAKIAATFMLKLGRKVGLVTCDTYRIAAVDQLRTYANIIGLPLQVALSPADMKQAVHSLKDCDVILIDTAGRSQNDSRRIAELREFIKAADAHEVHLVLSATAGEKVLRREAEAFAEVGVHRLVLTKLDEAVSFGGVINIVREIAKPLSFVTTGQEVPDHFEAANAARLADLALGAAVRA